MTHRDTTKLRAPDQEFHYILSELRRIFFDEKKEGTGVYVMKDWVTDYILAEHMHQLSLKILSSELSKKDRELEEINLRFSKIRGSIEAPKFVKKDAMSWVDNLQIYLDALLKQGGK